MNPNDSSDLSQLETWEKCDGNYVEKTPCNYKFKHYENYTIHIIICLYNI